MKTLKFFKFTLITLAIFQLAGTIFLVSDVKIAAAAEDLTKSLLFTPQINIPNSDIEGTVKVGTYDSKTGKMSSDLLGKYIQALYNYGLAIAGILAAVVLMAGGVLWLTSSGEASRVTQAKDLIIGSITGMVILFCSWVILNTVNPDLLKLKTLETTVIDKVIIDTCCEYPDYTAKDLITQKDCEKNKGKFFPKGHTISNATTGKAFCADTGCCRCSIGGSWKTLWFSDSNCIDEKNGGGKVLPDICDLACQTAGKVQNLPSKTNYVWGKVCNTNGDCVWRDGSNGGWGGGGDSF